MKKNLFVRILNHITSFFKYPLYLFNLALLTGLGIQIAKLWLSDQFDFFETVIAFPDEPEFINQNEAKKQFWTAVTLESSIFILGGFLCYELLIKKKSLKKGLIACLLIIFLWTAGESAFLFMPATEKAHSIRTCLSFDISWDTKKHKCRLMDLEIKRLKKLKALKKK